MKCLTVRSPWAPLILSGGKPLECRSWPTTHRGRLGIHVSARADRDAPVFYPAELAPAPLGTLAGEVELVDCRRMRPDDAGEGGARCDFSPDDYVWVLAGPIVYPEPIPVRGALGLWEWSPGACGDDNPAGRLSAP